VYVVGEKEILHEQRRQNRRQKVFNRKALRFCGVFAFVRGLDILKIDKISTDLQSFMFQFERDWSFV